MSEVHLIRDTGIGGGNYKYCATKEEYDSWFLEKSAFSFDEMSEIRGNEVSKNGYNVACVHIPLPYSALQECDYLSYKNDDYDRWFHCQVTEREYVNKESTRIYIVIDYVATYWDLIKLGKSFIERTHVTDDWNGEETASKYLLPEPFAIESRHRPDLLLEDPFSEVNQEINNDETPYFNMITSVDRNGDINTPEFIYQAGGVISGYKYGGHPDFIADVMGEMVTFTSGLINRYNTILENVSAIYVTPQRIGGNNQPIAEVSEIDRNFITFTNRENLPYDPETDTVGIRHAKVYDYFRYRIISNNGECLLSPATYKSRLFIDVYRTGGVTGCYKLLMKDLNGHWDGVQVATQTWPTVSTSATVQTYGYKINEGVKESVSRGLENTADLFTSQYRL